MNNNEKIYIKEEERLNVISHALGIAGGIAIGVLFLYETITRGGDAIAVMSVALYVFGMLSSYIFSTSYHACKQGSSWKRNLRKLDHLSLIHI